MDRLRSPSGLPVLGRGARRARRRQRGMTLIELLVAMSLMAILSVMGYKSFSALLMSRERLMAVSAQWVDLARVFARLGSELGKLTPVSAPSPVPVPQAEGLRLDGEAGGQVLHLALPCNLLAGGVDDIVYRVGPDGVEWSTARAAGQAFPLLGAGYRVHWRLQLDDGQWVEDWHQGASGRPRLLEMQVSHTAFGTITRYWRLP